jgi:hypothetical protein
MVGGGRYRGCSGNTGTGFPLQLLRQLQHAGNTSRNMLCQHSKFFGQREVLLGECRVVNRRGSRLFGSFAEQIRAAVGVSGRGIRRHVFLSPIAEDMILTHVAFNITLH